MSDELLDEASAPPEDMQRSLRDLRRINRWLGGVLVYRRLIRQFAGSSPLDIADLGTGTSDLLAATRKRPGRKVGIDFKIDHMLYGRELGGDEVLRVAGDAFRLPLRDGSVELVTSSHFFHHFSAAENVEIMDECLRVSSRGVIVTDTLRSFPPLLFVHLIGALRLVGRITRFDAPASVRQGYTMTEVRSIAAKTSAGRWVLVRRVPFRFGLLLWK